uniref:VCBS domain-containing protein n=1 Tax=Kordiimonas sp. TaxID=1970157 RepID=UPI003A933240
IVITVSGVNDAASFGGTLTGSLNEDTDSVSGSATVTDVDGANSFTAETVGGTYGDLTIAANGDWSYDLDEANTDVQALGAGDTLGDTLTVESADGTEQDITITISGVNDAASFGGDLTGSLNEDTDSVSGSATVTDPESANQFTAETVGGTYGELTIAANGDWVYDLDEANTDVQALGAGDTLGDTLTVESADGTEQSIVITVSGVNDAASFGGTLTGSLNEDTDSISGSATVTDPESANQFTAETVGGTFGDLTIAANGDWVYDLDEANTDVQALDAGDTLDDTLTVEAADGTEQSIVITVSGVNDAPQASAGSVTAVEDVGVTFSAANFAFSDADTGDALVSVRIDSLPGQGALRYNGGAATVNQVIAVADIGNLTYMPPEDVDGVTSFTFSVSDGTDWSSAPTVMSITLEGANDPPGMPRLTTSGVSENQIGAFVGTLRAVDPEGDAVTYSTSDSRFRVIGDKLYLAQGVSLDYETSSSITIRVSASDEEGFRSSAFVDIPVIDVVQEGGSNTQTGGTAPDTLRGSGDNDTLSGGGGNDLLDGGDGDDLIQQNEDDDGQDIIVGGAGNDKINAGGGNDFVIGGGANDGNNRQSLDENSDPNAPGADTIRGGSGDDTILGGGWNDDLTDDNGRYDDGEEVESSNEDNVIWAGSGNDVAAGSSGNDILGGSDGGDVIKGLSGDDVIFGNDDDDTVLGGDGDDTLFGGSGNDIIGGGDGDDIIWAGAGDDQLSGGDGADGFIFGAASGNDVISDFDVSADSLDFLGRFSSVEDVLSASADSTQEGTAGVLVNLGDGESVFLSGVTVEQLADANLVL